MPAPAEVAARLGERIGELATTLVGEPNRALSTRAQLRFGTKGSVAVELDGPERGRWFDHEAGVGGDALTLVESRLGLANGAACRWALEWLGDAPDLGHATATSLRSSSGGDQGRSAKVDQIVTASLDPAGTMVERYLHGRGITARPLPSSIRYRAQAHGRYGAMVAMATTTTGEVAAVQQVYLTEAGAKAPIPVPKRTNKARDDWAEQAAVRLPGNPPLILCEGVETALSLWQATGQEVWACLGVANIGKAPVPPKVEVIVARDGDPPGSPADRQIRGAVTVLQRRGHAVRVAEPPEGTDFNDLLQTGGEAAIRATSAPPATAAATPRPGAPVSCATRRATPAPCWPTPSTPCARRRNGRVSCGTTSWRPRPRPAGRRPGRPSGSPGPTRPGRTARTRSPPPGCSSRASRSRPWWRARRSRPWRATGRSILCATTWTGWSGTARRASTAGCCAISASPTPPTPAPSASAG